jgi:hypothetical protein
MVSRFWYKLLLIVSLFLVFTLLYKLLEKPGVYYGTIGKITHNYMRPDTGINHDVIEADVPFTMFIESKAYNWDASYYLSIRDSMYSGKDKLAPYRFAFYPFFPIVWKLSHANAHGIVLLNYLFFGLFLLLLSSIFLKGSTSEIYLFTIALLLPTSIAFRIPYTESLFALAFSLALIGLLKQKYWLYFVAMLCFSMTRPAALMFCAAFTLLNTMHLFRHRKIFLFIKECFLTVLPILTGVFIVTIIQYYYSHSWTPYIDACGLWPKRPDLYKGILDWSVEGFGMTTFAIFFFALPVIIYAIVKGVKILSTKGKETPLSIFGGNKEYIAAWAFNVSVLFITIFSALNLWASGYDVNGFSRYTMATPFFYIILFQLPVKLKALSLQFKISAFTIGILSIILFLISTEYAGDIFRFKYIGLYLLLLMGSTIVFEEHLSNRAKIILLALFIIPCSVWHAYLFNMYLGNAWIFT